MKKFMAIATLLLHTALCLNAQVITSFGAIADGEMNNAATIQKLIDKVSTEGGAKVTIPAQITRCVAAKGFRCV